MRVTLTLLISALTSVCSPQAWADPASLQGEWRQIASNAGEREDCRISIQRNGWDLTVTSNNGWSAVARSQSDTMSAAVGEGRWKPNFGGSYGGRRFGLILGLADSKLFMIMVPKPDGSVAEIRAAFQKWTPAAEAI